MSSIKVATAMIFGKCEAKPLVLSLSLLQKKMQRITIDNMATKSLQEDALSLFALKGLKVTTNIGLDFQK
jgi:hypothetical protein